MQIRSTGPQWLTTIVRVASHRDENRLEALPGIQLVQFAKYQLGRPATACTSVGLFS